MTIFFRNGKDICDWFAFWYGLLDWSFAFWLIVWLQILIFPYPIVILFKTAIIMILNE